MRKPALRGAWAAMVGAAALAVAACEAPSGGLQPVLLITEVAAAGAPDDWVEILNVSGQPIDLVDFVVVDERDRLDRARTLGAAMLLPGERCVRVLGDATTGFRLAGDEELWIYRAQDGALVDGIDWAQGASPPGGSLARRADRGPFVTVTVDTRGAANGGAS